MLINLNIKLIQPAEGETRLIKRFAYWPVIIGSQVVWFGRYEVLQLYQSRLFRGVEVEGKKMDFRAGSWIELSKRLPVKKVEIVE